MNDIKQLGAPSYVVDPQVLRRFDQRRTVFGRRAHEPQVVYYQRDANEGAEAMMGRNQQGYSWLELARSSAAWTVANHFHGAYAWERMGEPHPVLGSRGLYPVDDPALMSARLKETARTYGADLVGIAHLDRRWVYARAMDGTVLEIPDAFSHVVVMGIHMDSEGIRTSPAWPAATATGVGYSRMAFSAACLAQFIRNLGYRAIPMGNDTALSIPLAIDAGLGEMGRNGLLVTPEYGPCIRLCKVFTDIPLQPDRPIAFGLSQTCQRCRRCADACEVQAISQEGEPSYKVACLSNNPGILRWAVNQDRCYGFWLLNGASCSTCISVCPFCR